MIVTGNVFDNDMKIIPNVNVVVLNENRSTTADVDGKFSVKVNSENSQLRFSHAGYDYDTISVKEFKKLGYINLFPPSLPEIIIPNPYTKKTDNTWLWLLGISGLGFIGYKLASKKKAVNVTV
jgi:hypothetical protein